MREKDEGPRTKDQEGLPKGWVWTTVGDATDVILGQSPPSSSYNENGIGLPFYQGKAEFGDIYPAPRKWCTEPHKIAEKGDVLISVRAPVGPTNICPDRSCIGRGLAAIRARYGVQPLFLLYFLRSMESAIAGQGTGTTFSAISGDKLRALAVPLPPLPEQHRIVARIEELFTQLDAGVEALRKVQAQLKRYRQAVLNAAVRGELTREWREEHRGEIEPAEAVLERVREERRARGLKDVPPVDTSGLPELPEGWGWARAEQISQLVTDGDHNPPKRTAVGIPHLTAKNIMNWTIDNRSCTYISEDDFRKVRKRYAPKIGDVIITCVGTIGRTAVVAEDDSFSADRNLAVVRLLPSGLLPMFLQIHLNTPMIQQVMASASGSTAQPHLYLGDIRSLPVPLASRAEQEMAIEEAMHRLSVSDELEAVIAQNISRASSLRQSILQRAFAGKLAPQDPGDEPAEALLERLREGKERKGRQMELWGE